MTRRSPSDSSTKKFKVFEFEDDQRVEQNAKRFCGELGNRWKNKNKRDDSPINKYHFLQSLTCGTEIVDWDFKNEPIDVDAEVTPRKKNLEEDSNGLLEIDASSVGCQYTYSVMSPNSIPLVDDAENVENTGLDAYLISSSSTCKKKQVGKVPSETCSTETSSSPTSKFCPAENQISWDQQIERDCGGCEIDDEYMTVKIFPDFILYRDMAFMESCLTFSCSCIKLEGSTLNGTRETLCFEWAIGDIINIESEWSALVETVMVNFHLKSESSKGTENTNKTSGLELLKFSVYDPHWAKKQEAIKTLDVRYKDKWNIDFQTEMLRGEKDLLRQSSMFSQEHYISGSDEPFEDFIYPKGDPDAITISKRDIELLQPEKFINDTIIDFYIKYLANNIQSKEKHRFHFFNSFFFRKLADLDKDPSSAYEGKAAFQRVCKWTRKVNLFEKDYIFIPVNYSLHWSLLVICHPGEVPNYRDGESGGTSKVPCILHMDSIRGSHKGLKNLIRSYLCEEWKERHTGTAEDVSSKFLHLRFAPLELPQQENLFDCGLFLLHYVELFLEEAPLNFSPFNISTFSNFLSRNWFPPIEASLKRSLIKKLISEILEDPSQKTPPGDSIDKYPSAAVPNKTGNQESGVAFLEKICGSTKICHGISSCCSAEQIGVSLSETSLSSDQCFRKSGLVSGEPFEPGAYCRSSIDVNYQQLAALCQRIILSPIEEVGEIGEVAESPLGIGDCQQVVELEPSCTRALERLGKHEVSMHLRKLAEENSITGSSSGSWTLSEVGIDGVQQLQVIEGFNHLAEASSTSSDDLVACVVEDSEGEDSDDDSYEIKYISCTREKSLIRSTQKDHSTQNINPKGNNLLTSNEDAVPLKRGRRLTGSLSKDLHL